MMENDDILVVADEGYKFQEEENNLESYEDSTEAIVLVPENIDISESFFMGAKVSVIMCCLSLGIGVILTVFRRAV